MVFKKNEQTTYQKFQKQHGKNMRYTVFTYTLFLF